MAIPYDMPIVGYENNMVNTLRIWDAAAIDGLSAVILLTRVITRKQ